MGVYFTLWGLTMLLGARAKSRDASTSQSRTDRRGVRWPMDT